ncbi:hypothetical protein Ancab_014861, partial [Ancistrocladus abbreviatus]
ELYLLEHSSKKVKIPEDKSFVNPIVPFYKQKLLNSNAIVEAFLEDNLSVEECGMEEATFEDEKDYLVLRSTPAIEQHVCKAWGKSLIIKLLEKTFHYDAFVSRLTQKWQPMHGMQVTNIGLGSYTILFYHEDDYNHALVSRP